jgi:hypothetical protein
MAAVNRCRNGWFRLRSGRANGAVGGPGRMMWVLFVRDGGRPNQHARSVPDGGTASQSHSRRGGALFETMSGSARSRQSAPRVTHLARP